MPSDDIHIEPGARVDSLVLDNVSLVNRSGASIHLLHNRGDVGVLSLTNVEAKAGGASCGGVIVRNTGTIGRRHQANVVAEGYELVQEGPVSA